MSKLKNWEMWPNVFVIESEANPHSFGYVFIKRIQLLQEYNQKYIDISYINIVNYNEYLENEYKSNSKYPSLIVYFKNESNKDKFFDTEINEQVMIQQMEKKIKILKS